MSTSKLLQSDIEGFQSLLSQKNLGSIRGIYRSIPFFFFGEEPLFYKASQNIFTEKSGIGDAETVDNCLDASGRSETEGQNRKIEFPLAKNRLNQRQ